MKQNKGFTLIELIIVIAILAIIMLIASVAYGNIVFRQKVNIDKRSGEEMGKGISIAEVDGRGYDIPDYPSIIKYDEIEGIEDYVSIGIIPQSAPEGYYFVTRIPTEEGRRTAVGIATGKDEGEVLLNKVYNGKESGFAYIEGKEISKFLEEEGELLNEGTVMPSGAVLEEDEGVIPVTLAEVGSYIAYTPSVTSYTVPTTASGYTSDQTYNPSTYSEGWKVFRNNSGQLDIISAESIGNLTLKGATGYAKVVKTLNDLSMAYKNPTYATGARSLGYGDAVGEINTTTYPLNYGVYGAPYSDTAYSSDESIIDANTGLRHSGVVVWRASRYMDTYSSHSTFNVRCMTNGGVGASNILYYVPSSGSASAYSYAYGVRPIVSLKSGIEIIGGSGTKADPYRISI